MNRMLSAALAVATLASVSAPASATLTCGAPHQIIGEPGRVHDRRSRWWNVARRPHAARWQTNRAQCAVQHAGRQH